MIKSFFKTFGCLLVLSIAFFIQLGRILINDRQIGRKVIQTPQRSLPWPTDVLT
jgi:hypothetical protein